MYLIFIKKAMYTIITLVILCPVLSLAEEARINIVMNQSMLAGTILDNMLIGSGSILYTGEHDGFYLLSDKEINKNISDGKWYLIGSNGNLLKVKISGKGWLYDNNQSALISMDKSGMKDFYLYVDGKQSVMPDTYTIKLNGGSYIN